MTPALIVAIALAASDDIRPTLPPHPGLPTPIDDDEVEDLFDIPELDDEPDQEAETELEELAVDVEETTSAPTDDSVRRFVMTWPAPSKLAVLEMLKKYGAPDEMTPTMIIWIMNDPWTRTVVHKMPTPHAFPHRHVDVLEQTVPLRVPADKVDDLARFSGSIAVNRTKGEVTVTCERESMSFLALNLAKDIVDGRRSVEQARIFYARAALKVAKGRTPSYVAGLRFRPTKTPFLDETLIKDGKVIEQARR